MTGLASVKQIDRVEAPSRQEFEENYVKRRTPVIITGVGTEWRARQWTPEYLAKIRKYGVDRADEDFREEYDWFQQWLDKDDPLRTGLYDLNRYYAEADDEAE